MGRRISELKPGKRASGFTRGTRIRPPKRVAIVHDWCPDYRGGERVLAELCKLFKGAEVFTLFDFLSPEIKRQHFPGVVFHTSIANRFPGVRRYYRALFPLCPFLIEQFDVTGFDAVISSSAAFARGVLTRPDQPHLCYVHTPVRYAWDEQFSYFKQGKIGYGPKGLLFRYMLHKLRIWDARTANGPDLVLANSSYVRSRIKRIYGVDAQVDGDRLRLESSLMRARQEISKTKISMVDLRAKRGSDISSEMQTTRARLEELKSKSDTSSNLLYETEVLAPQALAAEEGSESLQPKFKLVRHGQTLGQQPTDAVILPGDTLIVEQPRRPAPAPAEMSSETTSPPVAPTASVDIATDRLR